MDLHRVLQPTHLETSITTDQKYICIGSGVLTAGLLLILTEPFMK